MRALRKLRTFWRLQAVFEGVMERDDEIRAMRIIAKTLEKLDADAAGRVMRWATDRYRYGAQVAEQRPFGPKDNPVPQA